MTTPARLKYTNSNNNEEIIGVFRPEDPTEGNIDTFTIDHDAIGYARVVIEGDPSLQRKMPVVKDDFGTTEREIIVEVDKQKNGTWEKRARVYPEGPGTTDDQGRYKHKNLWGFKRETGEDDVTISTAITTDIVEVLNTALPSGYTVVYPSDKTPPSVNEFTFDDAREQLYMDIQEDYEHYIIFTPFTDSNGNIEVKLQPKGYGGTQFSLTRGQDPMVYDYFKPRDTSNVISKVRIVGTTPNNVAIDQTYTPADYTDLNSADKDRYKKQRVDFLGGTESEAKAEAKRIAKNILNPQARTSLALDTTLRVDNNLNQSVGLIDDSRVVDSAGNTLDDVFTVVKQKDFLHEGLTYLSFEFEKESTKAQRRKWREHDSQQSRLYPSNQRGLTGETGNTAPDVNGNTGDTGPDVNGETSDTGPNVSGLTSSGGDASLIDDDAESSSFSSGLGSTFTNIATATANVGSDGASGLLLNIRASKTTSESSRQFNNIEVGVEVGGTEVAEINGNYPTFSLYQDTDKGMLFNCHMWVPANIVDGDSVDVNIRTAGGTTQPVEFTTLIQFVDTHEHGDGTLGADLHPHSDGTLDADLHPHGDGTLDSDNHPHQNGTLEADVTEENKTDRPQP